jgi:hypothetical protein
MKKIAVLVVAVIGLAACRSGVALAQTLSYYLDAPQYQITKDSKGFDKIEMTGFRTVTHFRAIRSRRQRPSTYWSIRM